VGEGVNVERQGRDAGAVKSARLPPLPFTHSLQAAVQILTQ
jgi:hypothetical protein